MAPQTPPADHLSEECLAAWKSAGGDASEETVDPSGLWITAILECGQVNVIGVTY